MHTAFVVSALAFIIPALAAPTIVPITKRAGPVKQDSYVVKFKDGTQHSGALAKVIEKLRQTDSSIAYDYSSLWNGFAATLTGDNLDFVRKLPEVDYIEEDSILSLSENEVAVPGLATPPLAESHDTLVGRGGLDGAGSGVTVYGIDTGIYTAHNCFEGRAKPGKNFIEGESDQDLNGHGTHTAATAVCKTYGIATGAEVKAVKVLDKGGSGSLSGVMAGVQWAHDDFKAGTKAAVATMSLGASDPLDTQKSLDTMVEKAIEGGLHFTIAAGNENMNAKTSTPARVKTANTIGAVDSNKNNEKASFSNWGELIDVWAPGVNIKSAWIGNPDAENTISGTSMATPHVAGILAVVLGKYEQMSPADLSEQLKKHGEEVVTFAPADTLAAMSSTRRLARGW